MRATEKAAEVLALHACSVPVDVELVAVDEDLEVVDCDFQTVEEVWLWPCIGVRRDLSPPWRRWVIAHALGHHFLHRGNQLRFRRGDDLMRRRQEAQAEQFAAWLLMPEREVARLRSLDVGEFAERFGVPPECVTIRFPR